MPSQTTPLCNWHYFTCCIPDQHCSALQWRGSARAMLLTLVTLLPTREEVCGGKEAQRFVHRCVPLLQQRPIACCCGRRHICSSSSHPLTLRPLHPQHPLCCPSISATLRRRRRQRLAASMRWYESLPPPFAELSLLSRPPAASAVTCDTTEDPLSVLPLEPYMATAAATTAATQEALARRPHPPLQRLV